MQQLSKVGIFRIWGVGVQEVKDFTVGSGGEGFTALRYGAAATMDDLWLIMSLSLRLRDLKKAPFGALELRGVI